VTILEGDTVTWSNTTSASHTVTSDDSGGPIKSSQIKPNGTYSLTFSKIGTFQYHCDSQSTQGGTIVAKA
jgi:plastocyanin